MKMKTLAVALVTLLLAVAALGQATNSPSFSLNFNVLSGPGGVGTDIAGTYAVSANFLVRQDTLIFPGVAGNFFGAGLQYSLPQVCGLLANTNLNCEKFQPYVTGSAGVTRVPDDGVFVNHIGVMGGFGANYDPTGTGKFSVNLIDFHLARLPGMTSGLTPIVSLGVSLGWGTNGAAMAQNEVRRQKRLAKERKRMEKLQKAAATQS